MNLNSHSDTSSVFAFHLTAFALLLVGRLVSLGTLSKSFYSQRRCPWSQYCWN
jgi:hypothetical protein